MHYSICSTHTYILGIIPEVYPRELFCKLFTKMVYSSELYLCTVCMLANTMVAVMFYDKYCETVIIDTRSCTVVI